MIRRTLFRRLFCLLIAAATAGACTGPLRAGLDGVDAMTSSVSPRVSPSLAFRTTLADQYRRYARLETEPLYDATDRQSYQAKAARAEAGVDVQPEDPHSWNVATPELTNAYDMLQIALVPDRKKILRPVPAAQAQAAFDCWVEQTQEKWGPTRQGSTCRARFYGAFCRMYLDHCEMSPAASAVRAAARLDRLSRVYFTTGSAALDPAARVIVRDAARAYRDGGHTVLIAGHTDRVGSAAANQLLSLARSRAVARALEGQGVPANAIQLSAFGEAQPLIDTPDNMPSHDNRRALIVVR